MYDDKFEKSLDFLFMTRIVVTVGFLFAIFLTIILAVAGARIEAIKADKGDSGTYEVTQELLSEIEENQDEY